MAKTPKQEAVAVRLSSTYSGYPGNPGPGVVISVPAAEAAHIVASGGGEVVK